MNHQDPDRWVNPQSPGAHEWWYFDAISDDGRDAIVLVWYSALPFDPAYGVASLRHIRQPDLFPKPHPLDHCAIGFSWYRDGKTMAYALNSWNRDHFSHDLNQKGLELSVGRNSLNRQSDNSYRLQINTPILGFRSKRAQVDITFKPSDGLTAGKKTLAHPVIHTFGCWPRPIAVLVDQSLPASGLLILRAGVIMTIMRAMMNFHGRFIDGTGAGFTTTGKQRFITFASLLQGEAKAYG